MTRIYISIVYLAIFCGIVITSVLAQNSTSATNLSLIHTPNQTSVNTTILNLTQFQASNTPIAEEFSESNETPERYTGIIHPGGEPEVQSSTPDGNPLIPKYAQGGVSVDFRGHTMEGRGNDVNVSSEISFHDHTDVFGYIKTIVKDFHYMSEVDTESEE